MLSTKLKELRIKNKLTQHDMANLLNIKRQTYSAYERGISFPDIVALIKIAKFFGVSTDYLLDIPDKTIADIESLYLDLTEEEKQKVQEYIEFLKSKRNE